MVVSIYNTSMKEFDFSQIKAFEWDNGNLNKNFHKHGITNEEAEEVFFDYRKKIIPDNKHSIMEKRFLLIGKNKKEKKIFIVFIIRKNLIRIISARPLNKKEYYLYE